MSGGAGFVGGRTARVLRRLQPELPLWIGGRDMGKAEALAASLGHASAVPVDLGRRDLGLAALQRLAGEVGLHAPDVILAPETVLGRLEAFGARIRISVV